MSAEDFWQRVLTQPLRQAQHVGHSLEMVGRLPSVRARAEGDQSGPLLESWLIHVRLLAEFLLVKPANLTKDFSARDFGWDGATTRDTSGIRNLWTVASQHLVHFSRERAPEDVYALGRLTADWSTEGLIEMARDVLELADEFVTHIERDRHSEAHVFREHLMEAMRYL